MSGTLGGLILINNSILRTLFGSVFTAFAKSRLLWQGIALRMYYIMFSVKVQSGKGVLFSFYHSFFMPSPKKSACFDIFEKN